MSNGYENFDSNAVAVIGMACRFPGAKNIDEFWNNLKNGIEAISFFSEEEILNSGADIDSVKSNSLVKAFGLLENSDKFDAEFFGFSPREAELLDPQIRMFLECAWEAMENAAYDTDRIDGRVGVYASSSLSSYLLRNILSNKEHLLSAGGLSAQLGNDKDHIPTRVSYAMNLKGPSISIGTACSSSLVAVHLACQGLLDYHCDMALTGGVTVHSNQIEGYFYNEGGIASPDGHCRTFDSKSGGTVSGCGVGTVVLKRLEDAVRDNDNIYAVVLSSAVNNDGSVKVSYTAPGIDGQSEVIAEAHSIANINPETISYIEAHGTATKLGDPIEIAALKKAFNSSTNKKSFCAIGSVKSNMGHLDSAAGIAGFIKTVLSLKNKQIPPSLHFENPNPSLNISDSPFYVNHKLSEWISDGFPRRAGVSSFAMGGTNAHLILQEAEDFNQVETESTFGIIPISAKTESALANYSKNLFEALSKENLALNNIAYSFQMGRKPFKFRKAFVAGNLTEFLNELSLDKSNNSFSGIVDNSNTDVVFMFSGLGAHYINMGLNLFNNNKVFHKTMIKCSEIFKNITGVDLLNIIYSDGIVDKSDTNKNAGIDFFKMIRGENSNEETQNELEKTIYAHPAIFSIEYSLAQMCLDLGIKPSALIGHSIGEYSALCFSGALSLEDSLNLIIKRAQILEDSPTGEMLTVDTAEENIKEYLNEKLSIAAVNDSSSCVIAGEKNEIDLFRYKLDDLKIIHRPVKSQRAFHSHLLELKKEELKKIFENIHFHKPRLPIISNLTGDWLTDEEMNNPDYWVSHTTKTVRFYSGIQKLFSENYKHFLEIGPGQNLASFVLKSNFKKDERKIYVNTIMKNVYDSQPDYEYLMRTIAKLWTVGIDIRWEGLYNKNKPKRISLPSYPFEHKRYWIDEKRIDYPNENDKSGVTYFTWNKSFLKVNPIAMTKDERYWLIFNDNNYCIDNLKDFLGTKGIKTIVIKLSDKNEFVKQDEYIINTNMKNSFGILFSEFEKNNIQYMNIVYLPSSNKRESGIDYSIRDITLITGLLNVLCLSNNKFNLSFLLENAFNISGNEDINPETAAVFGFIKSIDKECKNIKTFCFETEQLNKNQNLVYSNLLGSVLMQSNENIAAFRGNSKWIPGYNQIAETLMNTKDENHEKILVIGNNSKLKNNIVEELNEKKNKQIILARKEQEVLVNNDDFISLIEKQIDKRLSIKSIEEYEGLREKLDKLCGAMAANYLSKLFEWKAGKEISVEILRSKIITKHQKFFDYLLMITAEDKYITIENDVLFVRKGVNEIDENSIEEKKNQIEYNQFKSLINLLEYAVASYLEVFSGRMENVKVFNNNESEVFNQVFLETPLRFEKQKVYINTVRELLKKIIDKNPNRKINILEVGGGTGKLTGNILADLFDKNVEYHFTDIGKSFLADAKRMTDLININFMKFDKFDISQDPKKQGINLSKYDIILAYDVVHATENIAQTIHNLEMVTAPGGIMLIVESIQPRRWTNMMWGLQTGWWHFNDFRNDYLSPLLNLDDWDKLLSEFDLNFSATYPKEEPRRSRTAFGLIVAQKKGETSVIDFDIHNLQEMFKQEYENNFKNVQTHNYDLQIDNQLNDEFQEIKNVYGKFDSIYLCENYIGSMPIILSDYEHHKDTAKFQIVRINKFIDSIKSSGLLEGKLNILFEKPTSLFNADQSIVSEYINSLPSESEFDITSINISEDYFANSNKLQITDVLGTISSTQIYFSPDKHYKKKEKLDTKIDNQHNIYTRPNLNNEYCEPVNDTEFKLAEIWKFMFGIEKIGSNDNFFELGGDSLMATKIITRIKNELNFVIQLPLFFQKPTIKAIAEKIISDKNMINRLTSELNSDDSDREEGEI